MAHALRSRSHKDDLNPLSPRQPYFQETIANIPESVYLNATSTSAQLPAF